jgi:hypothetical protein
MSTLPQLPNHPDGAVWSPSVYGAYQAISDMWHRGAEVLQNESESGRLKYHADTLTSDAVPILLAMEQHAGEEKLPVPWIHQLTNSVGTLIAQLCQAQESAKQRLVYLFKW